MDFLSFVIREILTFEVVVSNRSPWAINQKIFPGPDKVNPLFLNDRASKAHTRYKQ